MAAYCLHEHLVSLKTTGMDRQLFAPRLDSAEEKKEYLDAISAGEISFPWMNGGMGIDFSNEVLVQAVIAEGGIGTLSGAMTGYPTIFHTIGQERDPEKRQQISHAANKSELLRKVNVVREQHPHGLLGVNLMHRASDFQKLAQALGESNQVDFLFVGAGLPRDLPVMMKQFPNMQYVPIVSTLRAAAALMSVVQREGSGNRLPGAIYDEDPTTAGAHLGAKDVEDASDIEKFDTTKVQQELSAAYPKIPLILAGGIAYEEDVTRALDQGYSSVSLGTRMLLTQESGLSDDLILNAYLNPEREITTSMTSPAGLPSRHLKNPEMYEEVRRTVMETRRACVGCMAGHADHCKFLNTVKSSEDVVDGVSSYCISKFLTATRLGYPWGVHFTGGRLDEMRKDLLYRVGRLQDGALYVPTVREAVDFVLGKLLPAPAL